MNKNRKISKQSNILFGGGIFLLIQGGQGATWEGPEPIPELKKYEKMGFQKLAQIEGNCTISWGSKVLFKKDNLFYEQSLPNNLFFQVPIEKPLKK